jgi:ubiquinone/menaquinone biosynthesis C-methylase UbiE
MSHRAMILIYLVLEQPQFTPFDAHYFPEANLALTRLSEPKNYSGRIKLRREDVQNLPFEDEAFDTIFSSLVFCSVDDPIKGLAELRRVLKKGGQLVMLEHVRSKGKSLGSLMDKLNPLIAKYGVDNINRDTVENLRKVGFRIEQERNLAHDIVKAIVAVK